MNTNRIEQIRQIFANQQQQKIVYSLLTDEQLDQLERIWKNNEDIYLLPIARAIEQGFKIPDNPEYTTTELLKFYLNKNKKFNNGANRKT